MMPVGMLIATIAPVLSLPLTRYCAIPTTAIMNSVAAAEIKAMRPFDTSLTIWP